jgi:hypothetical protein
MFATLAAARAELGKAGCSWLPGLGMGGFGASTHGCAASRAASLALGFYLLSPLAVIPPNFGNMHSCTACAGAARLEWHCIAVTGPGFTLTIGKPLRLYAIENSHLSVLSNMID